MDHVGNMYLPIKSAVTKPVCACHIWAGGRTSRVDGAIVMCKLFLVILCIDCFDKFHTLADVEELRRSVINQNNSDFKSPKFLNFKRTYYDDYLLV